VFVDIEKSTKHNVRVMKIKGYSNYGNKHRARINRADPNTKPSGFVLRNCFQCILTNYPVHGLKTGILNRNSMSSCENGLKREVEGDPRRKRGFGNP
jgi:hypothetical protein